MAFAKYSNHHHLCRADRCGNGDHCRHDQEQEEGKIILWMRVLGLPDERFLPSKQVICQFLHLLSSSVKIRSPIMKNRPPQRARPVLSYIGTLKVLPVSAGVSSWFLRWECHAGSDPACRTPPLPRGRAFSRRRLQSPRFWRSEVWRQVRG